MKKGNYLVTKLEKSYTHGNFNSEGVYETVITLTDSSNKFGLVDVDDFFYLKRYGVSKKPVRKEITIRIKGRAEIEAGAEVEIS
jgi:hypothetical protein